ncbi:MAG: hypothetical protein Q3979_03970 [Actinomycetaceae bacterium]|nr:hypothetical protein [Actinomycetaceae bacterium]
MEPATLATAASDTASPREGLRAVASLRLLVESLELRQVEAALRSGMSWSEIASLLGVSRQAVHKKYNRRIDPAIDVPRKSRR